MASTSITIELRLRRVWLARLICWLAARLIAWRLPIKPDAVVGLAVKCVGIDARAAQ